MDQKQNSAEKRIGELEDGTTEPGQPEQQRKSRLEKSDQSLRNW
jgi:hypothetical protein